MNWTIVADSSCDLKSADIACEQVGFSTVPFIFNIGNSEYIDSEDLDIPDFLKAMENCPTASGSACPSPNTWAEFFEASDKSIAITISANLSASFNSAVIAKDTVLSEHPEKQIAVLNSYSTGAEVAMCIKKIAADIKAGYDFETVVKNAENFLLNTHTTFALCSFDNLVKNGRMGKISGFVARKLGMWGIGIASKEGTISMKGISRGSEKALNIIINDMKDREFSGNSVTISHCQNPKMAQALKEKILQIWENAQVSILETRGLDSFYAERGGLIVGFN